MRRRILLVSCGCCWFSSSGTNYAQRNRRRAKHSRWNDGPSKKGIIDFVERVTRAGGPDYVKSEDRIATFDYDGTLWAEQPITRSIANMIWK